MERDAKEETYTRPRVAPEVKWAYLPGVRAGRSRRVRSLDRELGVTVVRSGDDVLSPHVSRVKLRQICFLT